MRHLAILNSGVRPRVPLLVRICGSTGCLLCFEPLNEGRETSNIEHPTSNTQGPMSAQSLDVGCWMFDVLEDGPLVAEEQLDRTAPGPVGSIAAVGQIAERREGDVAGPVAG